MNLPSRSEVLLLCGVIFGSLVARADDASDPRALFYEGVQLYEQGKYPEAVDRFTRSYQAGHRPKVLLNLGQAELKLGHDAAAAQAFRRFLDRAPADADSNRPDLLRFANDSLTGLKDHLGRLVVGGAPAGAHWTVDGQPIEVDPGADLFVLPGPHEVGASATGYVSQTVRVSCAPGTAVPVSLSLQAEPAPSAAPSLGATPTPTPTAGDLQTITPAATASHTSALIAWGVGGALGVAAIVTTIATAIAYNSLTPSQITAPRATLSSAEQSELTMARVSDGLWAATIVAGGVGGALWFTAGPTTSGSGGEVGVGGRF
jgi:hypothetical protein